jgi:hypothetical protein
VVLVVQGVLLAIQALKVILVNQEPMVLAVLAVLAVLQVMLEHKVTVVNQELTV